MYFEKPCILIMYKETVQIRVKMKSNDIFISLYEFLFFK